MLFDDIFFFPPGNRYLVRPLACRECRDMAATLKGQPLRKGGVLRVGDVCYQFYTDPSNGAFFDRRNDCPTGTVCKTASKAAAAAARAAQAVHAGLGAPRGMRGPMDVLETCQLPEEEAPPPSESDSAESDAAEISDKRRRNPPHPHPALSLPPRLAGTPPPGWAPNGEWRQFCEGLYEGEEVPVYKLRRLNKLWNRYARTAYAKGECPGADRPPGRPEKGADVRGWDGNAEVSSEELKSEAMKAKEWLSDKVAERLDRSIQNWEERKRFQGEREGATDYLTEIKSKEGEMTEDTTDTESGGSESEGGEGGESEDGGAFAENQMPDKGISGTSNDTSWSPYRCKAKYCRNKPNVQTLIGTQHVECDNWERQFHGIRAFRFTHDKGYQQMKYKVTCNKGLYKGPIKTHFTPSQPHDSFDTAALSRHHIACVNKEGKDAVLTSFQLEWSPDVKNQVRYRFTCDDETPLRCRDAYTKYDRRGWKTKWLARHNVKCRTGEVLSGFQLQNDWRGFRYKYRCCKMEQRRKAQTVDAYHAWRKPARHSNGFAMVQPWARPTLRPATRPGRPAQAVASTRPPVLREYFSKQQQEQQDISPSSQPPSPSPPTSPSPPSPLPRSREDPRHRPAHKAKPRQAGREAAGEDLSK